MRTIAATVLVLVGCLAFRGMAAAQELGAVGGVVKDPSGAVLPGVTVRVASVGLVERVRTTVTDGSGRYRVANLPPGAYAVTFSLPGYRPVVRAAVEVAAGLTAAVDVDMIADRFTGTVTGPRPGSAAQMRPYVRCGLTIVPGDAKVDPKIRIPFGNEGGGPSGRSRTEHSMRTITPQICAEK
jgi:hypothetical protein